MISLRDVYNVLSAMVPLYAAMMLGYGSVRWWQIFSPDQCTGINRFVALLAIPLLNFQFISTNDPYTMNCRFIGADSLQKLIVLGVLSVWGVSSRGRGRGGNDCLGWVITIFSLSTLPNTLVVGVPLLKGMYGESRTHALMAQSVVLQCTLWFTLLLVLFELRAARISIADRFTRDTTTTTTTTENEFEREDSSGRERKGKEKEKESSSSPPRPRMYSLPSSPLRAAAYSSYPGPLTDTKNKSCVNFDNNIYDNKTSMSSDKLQDSDFVVVDDIVPQVELLPVHGELFGSRFVSNQQQQQQQHSPIVDEEAPHQVDSCSPNNDKPMTPPATTGMTWLILTLVSRKLMRNPNAYSGILGLIWSLLSFKFNVNMPPIVRDSITIMSTGGLGMAMFSLGLFMASQPKIIACGYKAAVASMAIRFLVGPAVMAVSSLAMGLRGVTLHTAIVQAALPQAIVSFVYAKEYNLHPDILSTGVIFGMLIDLPVTLIYYILLGL